MGSPVSIRNASCAVVIRGSKVLAVSRKGNPNVYGLPAGKRDHRERRDATALRELAEETGLKGFDPFFVYSGIVVPTAPGGECFLASSYVVQAPNGQVIHAEAGTTVEFKDPEELEAISPFAEYHTGLFATLRAMGLLPMRAPRDGHARWWMEQRMQRHTCEQAAAGYHTVNWVEHSTCAERLGIEVAIASTEDYIATLPGQISEAILNPMWSTLKLDPSRLTGLQRGCVTHAFSQGMVRGYCERRRAQEYQASEAARQSKTKRR